MGTTEDGGWRVDPVHGRGGGAPIHSRFGNKWATIARFHNGLSNNVIKNHWNFVLKRKHATAAIDGVKERGGRRGRSLQNLQIWKWDLGGGGCCLMLFPKFMGFPKYGNGIYGLIILGSKFSGIEWKSWDGNRDNLARAKGIKVSSLISTLYIYIYIYNNKRAIM
ncbi:hypothetical protein RHGRI_012577 [Rhododendron griersonianum]|uniref:HTH myb-type domain-containing protein n=1 Tax=Rhododendron griersonianum TaxID=479676 RepID=A0AAV6KS30_9ERIC|nr:hypothetical protein RHGRI_012577 [Rhododendron griersonianum]KAG5555090.1 hypothetical protein RHGRI_012577 [Rhododendron griersonianum]